MVIKAYHFIQKGLPAVFGKPFFILIFLLISAIACVDMKKQDRTALQTVGHVDLNNYLGVWYEIARYPNRFQKGCLGSRATYSLRPDGKISVLNECYDEATNKLRKAEGKAWVVDKTTNAKLKVSFFWPFSGHYWIIELGKDYEYAVIGHPDREYLWILSRAEEMPGDIYKEILSRLEKHGYNTSRLLKNDQNRSNNET